MPNSSAVEKSMARHVAGVSAAALWAPLCSVAAAATAAAPCDVFGLLLSTSVRVKSQEGQNCNWQYFVALEIVCECQTFQRILN